MIQLIFLKTIQEIKTRIQERINQFRQLGHVIEGHHFRPTRQIFEAKESQTKEEAYEGGHERSS